MLTIFVRQVLRNHFPHEFCAEPVFAGQICYKGVFKHSETSLEYAVPVWQAIPTLLSVKIESIQKRALRIIFRAAVSYTDILYLTQLTTLVDRRQELCLK